MKPSLNSKKYVHGGTILTVLVISGVMSVSAISYLLLIRHHNRLSFRSQNWNLSMSVAEAGIEEGLQHLNQNYQALTRDGWSFDGVNYVRTRELGGGNSYTVRINPTSDPAHPRIVSRGFVVLPALAGGPRPSPYFARVGLAGQSVARASIDRAGRVVSASSSLFLGSLVAREKIDLKGNGILSDSFDSADPAKSTNGHYDRAKAGDKGDVASNMGLVGIVNVGNANIYGRLRTGPGGSALIDDNGMVGSHTWQATHTTGIEPGWATDDANYTFPDVTFPYTTAPEPLPGDILTVSGFSTNTTYVNNSLVYPSSLPAGSTMSPVTTNTAYFTVSTYPGAKTGLTTNSGLVTVTSYPGAMPGLVTNSLNFTSTASYPGDVFGLTTNTTWTTVSTYPGGQPQLTTNITYFTNQRDQPAEGTYVPGTLVEETNHKWSYQRINSYTYAVYTYTYPTSFSYSYLAPTYTYPEYTYSYSIYETAPVYTTNHYDHILYSGDYLTTALTGSVYVQGQARLVLPDGLDMSGGQTFKLGPNGSIEVWAGGTSVTVSGNGVINPSGFSGNFILYCTDTVTSVTLDGNGEFTGVLVAPNAAVVLNGAGSDPIDFVGSLMAKSVVMNGHFKFHYDEALGRMPMKGRFLITSWDEIP